jgi:ribosomal protein L21E
MVNKKPIRERGKIQLNKYFQKFSDGENVTVVRERSQKINFPTRIQGRTGVIEGKQGRNYFVKIEKEKKKFLIAPIHLKKIKTSE